MLDYLNDRVGFGLPSVGECEVAMQWGFASRILESAPSRKDAIYANLLNVVNPAIDRKNIRFFFGDGGAAVGYIVWIYLDESAEVEVRQNPWILHDKALRENPGGRLWLVDVVAPFGNMIHICRKLKRDPLLKDAEFSYMGRKGCLKNSPVRRRLFKRIDV